MLILIKKCIVINIKLINIARKFTMNINNQKNGNSQLNSVRNEYNDRLKRKLFMGNSNRVTWSNFRRFRTI